MTDSILQDVRRRIEREGLSIADVAMGTGIGAATVASHLAGAYARSDSLAKYRLWLQGLAKPQRRKKRQHASDESSLVFESVPTPVMGFTPPTLVPEEPRRVVDLFCGCGGMSLGFERFKGGQVFRTALALDIEEPMVRVFNDNHRCAAPGIGIARRTDITDFLCEAEILAFYLDHLSRTTDDPDLASHLSRIGPYSLHAFRRQLHRLDASFLAEITAVRCDAGYARLVRELGGAALNQTSVIGFHGATKLPASSGGPVKFGPLIWHDDGSIAADGIESSVVPDEKLLKACRARAVRLWQFEVKKLEARAEGKGHGQLASAADRMHRFLSFLGTKQMRKVRELWVEWRAMREAIRVAVFEDPAVLLALRSLYEDGHEVAVLLGGPPCQGFSRIGRGKIRSLREQSVHVQEDEESVDSRNQLLHQYVLFVSALAPEVFLFENVRHFQAVVRSEGIEFDAADVLADAIRDVSGRGLGYAVARQIVVASRHAVPQTRERFVMAGVRRDRGGALAGTDAATWCLSLQQRETVPLNIALEGLPEPLYVNSANCSAEVKVATRARPELKSTSSASEVFLNWTLASATTDGHLAREHRSDDAAFFALLGPGRRWMDYRCDASPTRQKLEGLLRSLEAALRREPALSRKLGIAIEEVTALRETSDGSLSLRLLLETIEPEPGEIAHHLLSPTYLRKREGAHGDWLSRMNGAQPSKTVVSHMSKDTYAFVHPNAPRTISVREAARIQSFPDDYKFGSVGLVDAFKVVGNAVPPLLSAQFAERVAQTLALADASRQAHGAQEPQSVEAYRLR